MCMQGHAGAQPPDPRSPPHQRHAARHRRGLCPLLAAAQRLQHAVRLAPPGAARLPARRRLLRLPPDGDGVHLHQPGGVRLPQQQLPEGAQVHAAALPVPRPCCRELRELPSVHCGQRGRDQGHLLQPDGLRLLTVSQTRVRPGVSPPFDECCFQMMANSDALWYRGTDDASCPDIIYSSYFVVTVVPSNFYTSAAVQFPSVENGAWLWQRLLALAH